MPQCNLDDIASKSQPSPFPRSKRSTGITGTSYRLARSIDDPARGAAQRRGDHVLGSGVGAASASRSPVVWPVLLEQNDEWAVQRARYMTLEAIAPLSEDPIFKLPPGAA